MVVMVDNDDHYGVNNCWRDGGWCSVLYRYCASRRDLSLLFSFNRQPSGCGRGRADRQRRHTSTLWGAEGAAVIRVTQDSPARMDDLATKLRPKNVGSCNTPCAPLEKASLSYPGCPGRSLYSDFFARRRN